MKTTQRITVVFDAQFGVDPDDPFDKDDNRYTFDVRGAGDENVIGSISGGKLRAGTGVYVEFRTGDVVSGVLTEPPSISSEREWKVEITHRLTGHTTFAPTFACYDEARARRSAEPYLNDPEFTVVVRSRPVGSWTDETGSHSPC